MIPSTPITVRTLGAVVDGGVTSFSVWAPERRQVELLVCNGRGEPVSRRMMERGDAGCWTAAFGDLPAGTLYKYRLDGNDDETLPDPASRYQPFGVHGPSQVVDPRAYQWRHARWTPPAFDALAIYELHVGTFSPEGTFRGAADRLGALAELGVTAIELMPVADFAGDRNWGYDGVVLFAPARCYGTPDDLRALVDAAHGYGLAVLLDVVYNHFGPDGAYANAFSPYYFTDAHESPWGRGVNLDGPQSEHVRRFFIENALHWLEEYRMDGLRLDATHALVDEGPRHFLAEFTSTIRAHVDRPVYFIAEDHRNLTTLVQPAGESGWGVDGVWADDFHHQVRVHVAKDDEGYYADFSGSTADLARTIEQGWFFTGQTSQHLGEPRGTDPLPLQPRQFVFCIQNHDQIGNRADGARLNHQVDAATFRAISALLLLAPETPMIFMGQEWAASSPFLYFTDHGEELGRKITEGRREEFSSFAAFADPSARSTIPDPQRASTFERSRLDWDEAARGEHAAMRRLYAGLLALRGTHECFRARPRGSWSVRAADEHTVVLDYRSGALGAVVRLSGGGAVRVAMRDDARPVLTTEDAGVALEPAPIVVERHDRSAATVTFTRPGALVWARSEDLA